MQSNNDKIVVAEIATACNSGAAGNGHRLRTKTEIAFLIRKTTRTVDAWMAAGILPYYKIGRSVLFDWEDCQRHLDEHFRVSRFTSTTDRSGGGL